MADEPLISIIVPIYNSAEFLEECLNSLMLQTYENLEFICVNDGSSDYSYDILREYREKDTRFVILNQEHYGISRARNSGFNLARGEFVSFIDSDDRISLSLYRKFSKLDIKPDIYMFNACEYDKTAKEVFPKYF